MSELRVGLLPEGALAAAAEFHAQVLPKAYVRLAENPGHLTLVFAPAGHSHRAWRLAAIQSLAREFAPVRVNGLASDSEPAITQALAYLQTAAGVTGQLLELDDTGAG
ncbi:MAG: Rossmann fold domain-containing protein [Novosphingobium sp.]